MRQNEIFQYLRPIAIFALSLVIFTGFAHAQGTGSIQRGTLPPLENTTPTTNDNQNFGTNLSDRITNEVAVFAGLDKITGRIIRFDVKIDETVQFGALQVTPKVCYSRPSTQAPQTTGFITVDEVTLNRKIQPLFNGWMFVASPGLNAVEHPVYDIWLADCKPAEEFSATPVTPTTDELGGRGFEAESASDEEILPVPSPNPFRV